MMTPYVRTVPVVHIAWPEGHALYGLVIRCTSVPLGRFMEAAEAGTGMEGGATPRDTVASLRTITEIVTGSIIGWNLEIADPVDGQQFVPEPNRAGFELLDAQLQESIVSAWFEVMGKASAPLAKGSPNGETPVRAVIPLEQIPMESLPSTHEQ